MFTYDFSIAPQIANVRLLIGDTDSTTPIFQDVEVMAALQAESSQSMIIALSGFNLANPVPQVVQLPALGGVALECSRGRNLMRG